MKTMGNILWILCGGLVSSISWAFAGLIWCVTIIGIPLGKQCFKFAKLSLAPFGKEIKDGGSAVSTVANIFWIIFTGLPMALENAVFGLLLCVTIVGIPFGKQFFKLAKLSLAPFGKEIE
ncbi:MAG: YccF domain-containing protein [Acutalibacteraceae bacterium]